MRLLKHGARRQTTAQLEKSAPTKVVGGDGEKPPNSRGTYRGHTNPPQKKVTANLGLLITKKNHVCKGDQSRDLASHTALIPRKKNDSGKKKRK